MGRVITLFLLLRFFTGFVYADFHTTASGMRYLLSVEETLAKSFLKYYHGRLKKIGQLENFLDEIEDLNVSLSSYKEDNDASIIFKPNHETNHNTPTMYKTNEEFVGNPTNSYVLIKRMISKWVHFIEDYGHSETETDTNEFLIDAADSITGFADLAEYRGSIFAILKVQQTYKISVKQYVDGIHRLQHQLTPMNVFDIGKSAINMKYFREGREWLEYTLELFTSEFLKYHDHLPDLLEYIAWSAYQTGDLESAIDYTQRILEMKPSSKTANYNIWHYKKELIEAEIDPSIRDRVELVKPWLKRNDAMCRNEEQVDPTIAKDLYCSYYKPHSQFILKPLKLEVVFKSPQIYIFHNFLSDVETKQLKESSQHRLDVAQVYDSMSGVEGSADYRLCKNTWLAENEYHYIPKIRQRVAASTGLNLNYAEDLQVANYGVGGSYEPHWDHATPPNNASIFGYYGNMGNRLATILMYLTDIETGGATVFTETENGVMTNVEKGSAVFWYNLHRNGTGDIRTRHGGCPVMLGEKWIANLWIHEHGQEFTRPCLLNQFDLTP